MSIRLYFDVDGLSQEIADAVAEAEEAGLTPEVTVLDIKEFKVYESATFNGTFAEICTVDYDPTKDYIEVPAKEEITVIDTIGIPGYSSRTNWFKLSYLDTDDVESDLSDPVLAQDIDRMVLILATAMSDTDREDPAFTDDEYILKFKEAVRIHKGVERNTELLESEISVISLLVRISCCYDLAYDNAKYSRLALPDGLSLNKGERVKHYLNIAEKCEKRYKTIVEDLGGDEDGIIAGTASFEVIDMTKKVYFNGLRNPRRR